MTDGLPMPTDPPTEIMAADLMFHHHLPLLLSRLALHGRHAINLYYDAVRTVEVGLCRLGASPFRSRHGSDRLAGRKFPRRLLRNAPLLIHYHIFKNAGTSFEWALEQVLHGAYRSFDSPSAAGFISARDLVEFSFRNPEVRAVSSHQAAPPAPRIFGREVLTSILIRDPIARIRSVYAFERLQKTSNPGALKAKELTFKEYVEWRLETSPALLCNFQVRFCCRTMEERINRVPTASSLDRAIANLSQVDAVGTVERYDEWLGLAQFILAEAFPGIRLSVSRQNVTSATSTSPAEKQTTLDGLAADLGPAMVDRLLEGNELDMRLHQVADAILTRKLAETGKGNHLRSAYREASRLAEVVNHGT